MLGPAAGVMGKGFVGTGSPVATTRDADVCVVFRAMLSGHSSLH